MPTAAWIAIVVLAALAALAGTLYVTKDSSTRDLSSMYEGAPTLPPFPFDSAPPLFPDYGSDTAGAEPKPTATPSASPSSPAAPTGETRALPTTTREGWIPAGIYTIPEEIGPGIYRVARGYTVWELNEDDMVETSDTIEGMTVLVIPEGSPSRKVDITGGAWPLEAAGPVDPTEFHDGVYLVGYDIEPGTYRVTPAPHWRAGLGYLARLDKDFEEIDNSLVYETEDADPTITMVIEPSDYAIEFSGVLEKVG